MLRVIEDEPLMANGRLPPRPPATMKVPLKILELDIEEFMEDDRRFNRRTTAGSIIDRLAESLSRYILSDEFLFPHETDLNAVVSFNRLRECVALEADLESSSEATREKCGSYPRVVSTEPLPKMLLENLVEAAVSDLKLGRFSVTAGNIFDTVSKMLDDVVDHGGFLMPTEETLNSVLTFKRLYRRAAREPGPETNVVYFEQHRSSQRSMGVMAEERDESEVTPGPKI